MDGLDIVVIKNISNHLDVHSFDALQKTCTQVRVRKRWREKWSKEKLVTLVEALPSLNVCECVRKDQSKRYSTGTKMYYLPHNSVNIPMDLFRKECNPLYICNG